MTAAIFAVVSPLQYINALEAVHAFQLKPERCYLALGVSRKLPASGIQLKRLLQPELWRAVRMLSGFPADRGTSKLHSEWLALAGARQYVSEANALIRLAEHEQGSVSHLFIGDYRPANFRHLMGQLPGAECWLLDDGSVTHQVVRHRKDPTSPHLFAKQFARETPQSKLRGALAGLKFVEPARLGFFTCYEFDPPSQDHVRRHGYEHYRLHFGEMKRSDEIWFLGSNHAENHFTSQERYIKLLSSVRHFYQGERVVYLPHRGEDTSKLELVRSLGFDVELFDLPVEIVVGQSGRFPKVLAGIASSAIDNLSMILGAQLKVHIFQVGEGYSTGERWKHLKDVIAYHERDVQGVSTFVHEEDNLSLVDRDSDLRLVPSSDTGGGGYFRDSEGWLRGYDAAESTAIPVEGGHRVALRQMSEMRVYRAGDSISVWLNDLETSIDAKVRGCSADGVLTFELNRSVDLASCTSLVFCRRSSRLEYDERSRLLGCLVEPRAQNLLCQSEALDHGSWELHGLHPFGEGSLTRNALFRAPNGRNESFFLQLNSRTSVHQLSQKLTFPGEGEFTLSVYCRGGGVDELILRVHSLADDMTQTIRFCELDWDVTDPSEQFLRGAAVDAGHGWFRYSMSGRLQAGLTVVSFGLARDGSEQFEGDGCSGMYIWGTQLEAGGCATSYVPTRSWPRLREPERVSREWPTAQPVFSVELLGVADAGLTQVLDLGDGQRVCVDLTQGLLFVSGAAWEQSVQITRLDGGSAFTVRVVRADGVGGVVAIGPTSLQCPQLNLGEEVTVAGGPVYLRRLCAREL